MSRVIHHRMRFVTLVTFETFLIVAAVSVAAYHQQRVSQNGRIFLYYIKNLSLVFDVFIILETIKVVATRKGI
jgi:hypothetical protein